jgi:ATP-binding cassette, subfamily B, bacterial MsbA
MKTYFRLLAFARPYSRFLPRYFVFALLGVFFGLMNFTLIIPLLNVLFETGEVRQVIHKPEFSISLSYFRDLFWYYFSDVVMEHGKLGALKFVCAVIFVSVLLSNLFKYLAQKVLSSMRTHLLKNVRQALFNKLTDLHLGYFYLHRKGDLMSSLSNDVQEVENSVVSSVQVMFREPLMLVGFFIILFTMSVKLTLFTLIILPVSGFIISFISRRLKKDAASGQKLLGTIMSIIDETISGVRIIKAFNAQSFIRRKFEVENQKYTSVLRSVVNKRELSSPLSEFLGVTVVTCILLYGGQLVLSNQSELTASEFIGYIILYSQVLVPAKNISGALTNIQKGMVSGERILSIIDEPVQHVDQPEAQSVKGFSASIEFRNVSFAYHNFDDRLVLKNINITVSKGKTVALVGQSGSGKSTLADLIPRFYDAGQGEIRIDGIPVKNIRIDDLRSLMGIVTQESILFNDTVYNNIAFGMEDVPKESVEEAARVANAHDFILNLKDGYQTYIGDRGGKLSGGQRQRLSIARAVLKNPPILILDEATSALDTESEALVQDALFKLMQNRTSIVIAHRLSTVQHADEILVLERGEVVERGTHTELIARNGAYKKLYDLQSFVA